ncbi:MAG: antifreeze protein, partial [Rhodospirillaceae bacterium]|nr:antifreeze protein [Rhodospirillaceae bacterium]
QLWNGLSDASRSKRIGETAVLALVALGEDGPGKTAAPSLQHVIESLRAAGREADARALAVEAALVLGL